jgi:hypothetical protein
MCVAAAVSLAVGTTAAADPDVTGRSKNLVRDVPGVTAKVRGDSSFAGYGTAVLTDGKWIAKGQEKSSEWGHPERLGNGGNTWVSEDTLADHWIQLDWPQPVKLNEVEVCWSLPEWQPKAFRLERLADGRWQPLDAAVAGWEPTERQSVIAVPAVEVRAIRVVQPAGCGRTRDLMAVQEVAAYLRGEAPQPSRGVRPLSETELRRTVPSPLTPNVARLHQQWPGASSPVAYTGAERTVPAAALADDDETKAVPVPAEAFAVGVEWPLAHVVDQAVAVFSGEIPARDAIVAETHDGCCWTAVRIGLKQEPQPVQHRIVWTFEPLATRALRLRFAAGRVLPQPTELEVRRYLPPRKDVWPDRLVKPGGLQRELLAGDADPSFEALSQWALPMTPVRAFVGLKDGPDEIGVGWDGTLLGRDTIRFRVGEQRYRLAEGRDVLRRTLLDGWRPGVVVEARLGDLQVRQTVFSVAVGPAPSPAAALVRLQVTNLTGDPLRCPIQAEATGGRPGRVTAADRALRRGDDVVLLALAPPAGPGVVVGQPASRVAPRTAEKDSRPRPDGEDALHLELALPPHGTAAVDFVHPHNACVGNAALARYAGLTFESAYTRFRNYWDELLAGAVRLEVPEPRVQRMCQAVLAQLFINADGDIMPYGARPSVYDGNLYGVEESYAMLALAMWGFPRDAQRYLDATYLTAEFLRKVDRYRTYPDRHQQYRNGLQPHYAVSAYRLSRDRVWIAKHLPLLKQCAEWTMSQRRTTMQLEGGEKPLHWGLLPRWSYGGDIHDVQCYALFANMCCWRGLADTAWLLAELGDQATARRYADEAAAYRADIDRAIEGSYRPQARPPFLPLRLYADRPDEQMDYYQLFAGCMLDVGYFAPGSRHGRWITDFLETDNRMFCLLPRFRRDVGAGGLDALYAKGYVLHKLREDAIREFLLGFYAYLAFALDHETFVSRETGLLYTSDLHVRSAYRVPDMSDPVPCSSAVALHFLREMLATEDLAGPGSLAGDLRLLSAVPRAWLADGKTIRIGRLPTHFGPVTVEVRSAAAAGRIEARVVPPDRQSLRAIKLCLRHPAARPIRSVTVNGQAWKEFDPGSERIVLPRAATPYHVVANY